MDKFEDEYEIRGSGSGQVRLVCQGLHFSPVISWHFKTDWLTPLAPHILTCSARDYFPISVCYDLKSVRLEVDLWLPPIAGLISQISRYLVLPIILNHCFKLGDPCSEDRKIVPVIFHAVSLGCWTRLDWDGKTEKLINLVFLGWGGVVGPRRDPHSQHLNKREREGWGDGWSPTAQHYLSSLSSLSCLTTLKLIRLALLHLIVVGL